MGRYPPFSVDPGKLLEFKGQFEANYADTYLWVKEFDPDWNIEAEENESVQVPTDRKSMKANQAKNSTTANGWLGSSIMGKPTPVMFDWKNEQDPDKRRKKGRGL